MRPYFTLILFLASLHIQASGKTDPDSLLANRQFFELRDEMKSGRYNSLPAHRKLYFDAYLHNFFHELPASNREISLLLEKYSTAFTLQQMADLLTKKIDNHVKLYEYKQAHATIRLILKEYSSVLTAEEKKDLDNSDQIWKGLENTGPQTVSTRDNTTINFTRDIAGLINIPVRFGDSSFNFVFDTGANISVITESYARKTGIEPLNSFFDVKAITGLMVKANVGVAKEFSMGNIVIRNAVFMIFPDSALSIGGGVYTINGIIGFPIIEQLQEIHISKNKTMMIPATPADKPIRNFGLDELMPVINVGINNDTLAFTFDTGADETMFNEPFYKRYRAMIDSVGIAYDMKYGGAGGIVTTKAYRLPVTVFTLGKQTVQRSGISVRTDVAGSKDKYYYGNLGQDVMNQFNEMIINFRYMYVDFVK